MELEIGAKKVDGVRPVCKASLAYVSNVFRSLENSMLNYAVERENNCWLDCKTVAAKNGFP